MAAGSPFHNDYVKRKKRWTPISIILSNSCSGSLLSLKKQRKLFPLHSLKGLANTARFRIKIVTAIGTTARVSIGAHEPELSPSAEQPSWHLIHF